MILVLKVRCFGEEFFVLVGAWCGISMVFKFWFVVELFEGFEKILVDGFKF